MSSGFRKRRKGSVVATFSAFEADLLRNLASQLIELLSSEAAVPSDDPLEALLDFSGPTQPPDDAVLARLFPTAYRDDEEAAGEFRRFTETELRSGKAAQAGVVVDDLESAGLPDEIESPGSQEDVEVEVDLDHAMQWMRCLTDLRLALATRLGIQDDDEGFWDGLPDEDPRKHVHDIYDWLGFVQETLVRSVS